ncbi:E3 ubiquitin-protein ligase TRIM71-like [Ptychodera flava]|uniref:E3 ubiquitin-protein ligase TRIM71-like n=1 Tax=Ptychodera flava TaxID=63121 RepID=UPI00396A02BC
MGCGSSRPVSAKNLEPIPRPATPIPVQTHAKAVQSEPPRHELECGFCKTKAATGFCVDCGVLICKSCSGHHKDAAVLKKHDRISLAEYKNKRSLLAKYVSPVVCSLHEGNEMTYYCKTCNVPMCVVCAEYIHKSPQHRHTTLIDALVQKHKALNEHVEAVKRKRQKMADMSESLLTLQESGSTDGTDLKEVVLSHTKTIVEKLRSVIDELQADSDRLIGELESDRRSKIKRAKSKEGEVQTCIAEYDKHLGEADKLLEHSNDIGFLRVVDTTCGYLKAASELGVTETQEDSMRFTPIEDAIEAAKKRKIGWLSKEKSDKPLNRESTGKVDNRSQRDDAPSREKSEGFRSWKSRFDYDRLRELQNGRLECRSSENARKEEWYLKYLLPNRGTLTQT